MVSSQKKIVILLVSLLILAIIGFIFRNQISIPLKSLGNGADTTEAIEKITPEIAAITEQIQQNPSNPVFVFQRADAYFIFGNLKYALMDYKKAFSMDPSQQAYAIGLADCYFEINYPDSSIYILELFLKQNPQNIDVLLDCALDYFLLPQPQYQFAIDKLNEVLKLDVQNADAYFYKGLIYKETGDTIKAISNLQTTIESNPDNYDAYMQLGLIYADQGNPLATKYFDNAISLSDSSTEAHYAKAKFLQDQGKMIDAISYYKNLILKDPQNADAIYNLATIYFGLDSIEKAYRMFDLAIKQSPTKKEAYFGKGLCAEQLNKNDEAILFYQQALNLDPNYTDAETQLKQLKEK